MCYMLRGDEPGTLSVTRWQARCILLPGDELGVLPVTRWQARCYLLPGDESGVLYVTWWWARCVIYYLVMSQLCYLLPGDESCVNCYLVWWTRCVIFYQVMIQVCYLLPGDEPGVLSVPWWWARCVVCYQMMSQVCYLLPGDEPADCYLSELMTLLTSVTSAKPVDRPGVSDGRSDNFTLCKSALLIILLFAATHLTLAYILHCVCTQMYVIWLLWPMSCIVCVHKCMLHGCCGLHIALCLYT